MIAGGAKEARVPGILDDTECEDGTAASCRHAENNSIVPTPYVATRNGQGLA